MQFTGAVRLHTFAFASVSSYALLIKSANYGSRSILCHGWLAPATHTPNIDYRLLGKLSISRSYNLRRYICTPVLSQLHVKLRQQVKAKCVPLLVRSNGTTWTIENSRRKPVRPIATVLPALGVAGGKGVLTSCSYSTTVLPLTGKGR